jgi:hypothetical protein
MSTSYGLALNGASGGHRTHLARVDVVLSCRHCMVYVDPENDLVAVVRWIDNNAVDGFLKRLIAAVAAKS